MPVSSLSGPNLNKPGITPVFVWLFILGKVYSLPIAGNTSHYCKPSVDTGQCWPNSLQTPFNSIHRESVRPAQTQA